MYGYILVAIVGLILLGFCIAGLARARPGTPKSTAAAKPAADEPTPGRSVTASESEVAAAQRHTPPA
jgi:hypothetical protein